VFSPAVPATVPYRVTILMPVFSDWACAAAVCKELDEQLEKVSGTEVCVLLIDDGSPDGIDFWPPLECKALSRIQAMRLQRNLGHQRAICAGLCHIYDHAACDAVLVMDADGEDRPEDALRLIELGRSSASGVVFAERRKRQEGPVFRAGYFLFRILHRVLTGVEVRVGNFSIVPWPVIRRLVSMPELWNHFAGAVFRSKAHFDCVPMDRGRRLKGQSHMDLASLVAHGLAGIATFQEVVATRILITNVLGLLLLSAVMLAIAGIRLFTTRAIPGWATTASGFAAVLVIQLLGISFSLVFTLISNRSNLTFVPKRDYKVFVDRVECLTPSRLTTSR
jgi:hypothetical protein